MIDMRKAILIIGIVGILGTIGGCKTTRQIQREVVRDTIAIYHHDTVRVERARWITKDSVARDTVFIVKDTAGRVVYKEVIRDRYVRAQEADTASFYVARKDSAARKKESAREEIKREKKEKTRLGEYVGNALKILGGICLMGGIYIIGRRAGSARSAGGNMGKPLGAP